MSCLSFYHNGKQLFFVLGIDNIMKVIIIYIILKQIYYRKNIKDEVQRF